MARGILWTGGDPRMTGCLQSPLARPVLAQSWSQTATDGACFSTTALLSGRDRPLRLCVLRPRGSEPKTRRTGAWRPPPPPSSSLLVARAGKPSSTVIRNQSMLGAEKRQCQTSNPHLQRTLRRARPEVCRWITSLAGSSSSWELRAGRTGPTVIALPLLQTAHKMVRKRVRQKLSVSACRSAAW